MQKKIISKIVTTLTILAMAINFAGSMLLYNNKNENNTVIVNAEESINDCVIQAGDLSVQSANSKINGKIDKTDILDNLDNGIMSMLDTDTQVVSNGYFGETSVSTDSDIYSSDVYSANGERVEINSRVIAEKNIYLTGKNILGNNSVLYSKSGNISINGSEFANLKGIIYAPNGIVTLNGANVNISGKIIAKEVYIQCGNFTINSNSDYNKLSKNLAYTNIPRIINLYGEYDGDNKELTLSWDEKELFKQTEIYARYSNNSEFEKIDTVTENEYKISENSISDNVDYKIVAHTKFGETVNSIVLSFEKMKTESQNQILTVIMMT